MGVGKMRRVWQVGFAALMLMAVMSFAFFGQPIARRGAK